MIVLLRALALVVAIQGLTACWKTPELELDSAKISAVVTVGELAALFAPALREGVTVEVLAPIGSDGHEVTLTASRLRVLRDAEQVFANGLGLDEGWLAPALKVASKAKVFYLSSCVQNPLRSTSHEQDRHVHVVGNPHWIYDPIRVSEVLTCLDSKSELNLRLFRPGALQELSKQYKTLADEIRVKLAPLRKSKLLVIHRHLSYFFDQFGLDELGVNGVGETEELKPSVMSELARRSQVDSQILVLSHAAEPRLINHLKAAAPNLKILQIDLRIEAGKRSLPDLYRDVAQKLLAAFGK